MGTFVVRMNISSIGYAMSHAAFAGAAFGLMINMDPLITALTFAFITAFILGPISEKAKLQSNIIIGFLFSIMIALALIFLNYIPGEAATGTALRILWGSLFSVDYNDVLLLVFLSFIILVFIIIFYKELLSIMFNRKLAEADGINTKPFIYLIILISGVVVTFSIKLVGGLLIYALLFNPASSALQFLEDMRKIIVVSPLIGIGANISGLLVSLFLDIPVGSCIVLVSTIIFGITVLISPKRKRKMEDKRRRNH